VQLSRRLNTDRSHLVSHYQLILFETPRVLLCHVHPSFIRGETSIVVAQ
jgi:hypothetical protein